MSPPSPPPSAEALLHMVANVFEAHTAALFVREPGAETLEMVGWESLAESLIPGARLRMGQGLIGWVARESRRLHVTEFDRDTRTLGIYTEDAGIKAFLASPLPGGRGVLMVDSRNRYAFPAKRQRILDDCANVASDLLAAAESAAELDFYRRWQSWRRSRHGSPDAALEGLCLLFDPEVALLLRHREGDDRFAVIAARGAEGAQDLTGALFDLRRGLAGWIFRHRTHLILNRLGRARDRKARSYILHQGEPFARSPVFVGLHQPIAGGALAWVFSGATDLSGWPEDFADFIVSGLGHLACREFADVV